MSGLPLFAPSDARDVLSEILAAAQIWNAEEWRSYEREQFWGALTWTTPDELVTVLVVHLEAAGKVQALCELLPRMTEADQARVVRRDDVRQHIAAIPTWKLKSSDEHAMLSREAVRLRLDELMDLHDEASLCEFEAACIGALPGTRQHAWPRALQLASTALARGRGEAKALRALAPTMTEEDLLATRAVASDVAGWVAALADAIAQPLLPRLAAALHLTAEQAPSSGQSRALLALAAQGRRRRAAAREVAGCLAGRVRCQCVEEEGAGRDEAEERHALRQQIREAPSDRGLGIYALVLATESDPARVRADIADLAELADALVAKASASPGSSTLSDALVQACRSAADSLHRLAPEAAAAEAKAWLARANLFAFDLATQRAHALLAIVRSGCVAGEERERALAFVTSTLGCDEQLRDRLALLKAARALISEEAFEEHCREAIEALQTLPEDERIDAAAELNAMTSGGLAVPSLQASAVAAAARAVPELAREFDSDLRELMAELGPGLQAEGQDLFDGEGAEVARRAC